MTMKEFKKYVDKCIKSKERQIKRIRLHPKTTARDIELIISYAKLDEIKDIKKVINT